MSDLPPTWVVDVRDGTHTLDLCTSAADAVLLVDGLPCAMVWDEDDQPDVLHVLRAYDNADLEHRLVRLPALSHDLTIEPSLPEQLQPLLRRLSNGRYRLSVLPRIDLGEGLVEPDEHQGPQGSWAGHREISTVDAPLVGTVPREELDGREIERVARRIRQGARPLVVLGAAMAGRASFLLIGHHTLEAYRRVGLSPAAVVVLKEDPRELSDEETTALVKISQLRVAEIAAEDALLAFAGG